MSSSSEQVFEAVRRLHETIDAAFIEFDKATVGYDLGRAKEAIEDIANANVDLGDVVAGGRLVYPTEEEIGRDLERQGGTGLIDMTPDDEAHIRRG